MVYGVMIESNDPSFHEVLMTNRQAEEGHLVQLQVYRLLEVGKGGIQLLVHGKVHPTAGQVQQE